MNMERYTPYCEFTDAENLVETCAHEHSNKSDTALFFFHEKGLLTSERTVFHPFCQQNGIIYGKIVAHIILRCQLRKLLGSREMG